LAIILGLIFVAWVALALVEQKVLKLPALVHVVGAAMVATLFVLVDPDRMAFVVTAVLAVGRAAMIALLWLSRPAAEGMAIGRALHTSTVIVALIFGAGAAVLSGIRPAILIAFACYIIVRGIREYWYKRRGGIDALSLSLTLRMGELATLLIGAFVR
jgi:hypothetical protein